MLFGVFSIPVNAEAVPNQLKYWQALYQFKNYSGDVYLTSWGGHLYQGFYSGEELFGDLTTAYFDASAGGSYRMFRYSGAVADVNKEVLAKVIDKNGYFSTGDVGYIDENGKIANSQAYFLDDLR